MSRRKLRDHLLALCSDAGVNFLNAEVEGVQVEEDGKHTRVTTGSGQTFRSRHVACTVVVLGGGGGAKSSGMTRPPQARSPVRTQGVLLNGVVQQCRTRAQLCALRQQCPAVQAVHMKPGGNSHACMHAC